MNKHEFFAALKPKVQEKEVPEVGKTLHFQEFSGAQRDDLVALAQTSKSASEYEAAVVIASVVDANGVPMFSADDTASLRALGSRVLSALVRASMEVNSIGAQAEEAAAKN